MGPSEVKYEAPLTKHLFRKATSRGMPLSGTIEVSPVCNFNCRMCYVRKSPQEVAAGERRMLEVGDWLRIAAQARDAGALYMLITGESRSYGRVFVSCTRSLCGRAFW